MRRTAANLCRGFEGSFVKERRRYLLILGAILALLVGAALLAVPGSPAYKKPTLGLDLRGGLEVVLKAQPQTRAVGDAAEHADRAERHGQAGQPDRRVLAERGDPGHRRDRHPARRHPRSGQGGGDHRLDRSAAVLRLREGPRGADRQPAHTDPVSDRLQPAEADPGPGQEGRCAVGLLPLRAEDKDQDGQRQEDEDDDQARDPADRLRRGPAPRALRRQEAEGNRDPGGAGEPTARPRPCLDAGNAAGEAVAEQRLLVPVQDCAGADLQRSPATS